MSQRENVRNLEKDLRIKVPMSQESKLPFDVGSASSKHAASKDKGSSVKTGNLQDALTGKK